MRCQTITFFFPPLALPCINNKAFGLHLNRYARLASRGPLQRDNNYNNKLSAVQVRAPTTVFPVLPAICVARIVDHQGYFSTQVVFCGAVYVLCTNKHEPN
jgi:hypothetical protein